MCVFFFFLEVQRNEQKGFPHVSTRNNVPEKKSFMAVYIQKLVLNIKNLFFPFDLILYTHKKKKSMEINPEEMGMGKKV